MKRLVMILLIGLFCMSNVSYAGNGDLTVGGNLEMTGSANGFLPPRMSTSARGNISPSPGMLIYNTDDNAYNYYTSSGWKTLAASLPVHDNTGASSDYALAVGEAAKITFSSATSVPLHIDCTGGIEYELTLDGDLTTMISNDGNVLFKPNNTTYSGAFVEVGFKVSSGNSTAIDLCPVQSQFTTAWGLIVKACLKVSTGAKAKLLSGTVLNKRVNGTFEHFTLSSYWNDTATAWTSLGTITFPFAQSGTIIIRRIL